MIESIDWRSFTQALMQKFAMLECIEKFYKKFSKWKISYFKKLLIVVPGRMIAVHYEMEDYLEFRSSSYAKYLDDTFFSVKFQHLTTHILPQSQES